MAEHGLSLVVESGGYSSVAVLRLLIVCSGFSCCRAQVLGPQAQQLHRAASVIVAYEAPEHRPSSCGAWAQLLCSTWDLPGEGIEPMPPVLAGRFSTSGLSGKLW